MYTIPTPLQNHLLGDLPPEVHERVNPHLVSVRVPLGKVLFEPEDSGNNVYFPTDCVVSFLYVMKEGASTEISVVGNEGIVGGALFTGGEGTTCRAIVQSAGHAYRLSGARLKHEIKRHGALLHLLLRYSRSLIAQTAKTAVCNRHHTIDQQLCRWLLLSLDRLSSNRLEMTQELLANMLGARREAVMEATGKLHKLGVIEYRPGLVTILSRPRLEELCCECFAVVGKGSRSPVRLSRPSSTTLTRDDAREIESG